MVGFVKIIDFSYDFIVVGFRLSVISFLLSVFCYRFESLLVEKFRRV